MLRTRVIVALVGLALVAAACSDSTHASAPTTAASSSTSRVSATSSTAAPAPACNRPHAAGQVGDQFDFQGVSRTYQLYVPAAYDGTKDVPLVFNIHGFGSNASQQMAYGDFKPLADRDDFIIVAPDGQDSAGGRHFNLTGESGMQDDILMISGLLDHLEATLCIDASRVYSTGMSDGGATTSVVACRVADRFAAFAPVAVIVYVDGCGGDHPVSIAGFMGTADPIVPFSGGKVNCCGNPTLSSAPDAMAGWAKHNACADTYKDEVLGTEVTKRTWSGCTGKSEVVFYMITGGGHTWPGAAIPLPALGLTTQQINASDIIWDFFKAHPLQS